VFQVDNEPVVGPLPTPEPGSVQAQPGYQFMMDFDFIGAARKPV
jgi:hypothetical protein